MDKGNNNIDFVARHYRTGGFNVKSALTSMGLRRMWRWSPARIAAVAGLALVMSATAAVMIHQVYFSSRLEPVPVSESDVAPKTRTPSQPVLSEVRTIDFEDAPLSSVVAEIKAVYGVEVAGMPDNADSYRLTLHFEGNIQELVDCVNDILGTDMYIKE